MLKMLNKFLFNMGMISDLRNVSMCKHLKSFTKPVRLVFSLQVICQCPILFTLAEYSLRYLIEVHMTMWTWAMSSLFVTNLAHDK